MQPPPPVEIDIGEYFHEVIWYTWYFWWQFVALALIFVGIIAFTAVLVAYVARRM